MATPWEKYLEAWTASHFGVCENIEIETEFQLTGNVVGHVAPMGLVLGNGVDKICISSQDIPNLIAHLQKIFPLKTLEPNKKQVEK
jgi:hypothetical protein